MDSRCPMSHIYGISGGTSNVHDDCILLILWDGQIFTWNEGLFESEAGKYAMQQKISTGIKNVTAQQKLHI